MHADSARPETGNALELEESGPMSGLQAVPTFRGLELQECDTLFESDIDQDPWVQYHATSSSYEERIDAQGLQWSGNIVSAADILDVICVFRSMNWYGVHKGGYTVLGSFSLADFQGEDFKPICFSVHSLFSLLYAERDFAGGETARALRYAIRDLELYLTEESIRDKHLHKQRRSAISLVSQNAVPGRVVRVNLNWLEEKVKQLQPLRERCDALKENYEHGVVYAVQFTREDIPVLSPSYSMGIRCYAPIPPEKLVAKARVLIDDVQLLWAKDAKIGRENLWRREDPNGLLAVLAEAEKNGQSYQSPELAHEAPSLIDLSCGVDESEKIALTRGGAALAEYVRQNPMR